MKANFEIPKKPNLTFGSDDDEKKDIKPQGGGLFGNNKEVKKDEKTSGSGLFAKPVAGNDGAINFANMSKSSVDPPAGGLFGNKDKNDQKAKPTSLFGGEGLKKDKDLF